MIRYIGKKLTYFLMTGPLFRDTEGQIPKGKGVRNFLGRGWNELKRYINLNLLKKSKKFQ